MGLIDTTSELAKYLVYLNDIGGGVSVRKLSQSKGHKIHELQDLKLARYDRETRSYYLTDKGECIAESIREAVECNHSDYQVVSESPLIMRLAAQCRIKIQKEIRGWK